MSLLNDTLRSQARVDAIAARVAPWGDTERLYSAAATAGDSADLHRNAPVPTRDMLYGLAGDVARAAAATTEANQYAVAAGFLTFLSAAVGRNAYLDVGNTRHHPRLFSLHVGRTSRGRKGDAMSLVRRIRSAIDERDRLNNGNIGDPFCGGHHHGGLSSREGLALLIHDGYKSGKEDVPAIRDKRLWIIESEFANVLHQSKRDGNTLSSALRDAWDGISIRPATKSARVWATDPHIALSAAITPSELLGLIESRELTNGFANRFMIFWAERERLVPFPEPTPPAVVDSLAEHTAAVIRFALGGYPGTSNNMRMQLSADARERYEKTYRNELAITTDGERVAAILERRAPIALRLAMLFALTDLTDIIGIEHLHAALAWARYHRESVRFIFNDAAGEEAARESSEAAAKILDYLRQHGRTGRADLSRKCFAGHLPASHLDEAIDSLLMDSPPLIKVVEGPRGENGKCAKFYELSEVCESGELGELDRAARLPTSSRVCEVGEVGRGGTSSSPDSPTSQAADVHETRANRPTSPVSPSSRPSNEQQRREVF